MAKGEAKKTNKMLEQDRATANRDYANFTQTQGERSNQAYGRSTDLFGDIAGGYRNLAMGNLPTGAALPSVGGGGYALPKTYGEVAGSYRNFMSGGGIDANAARAGQGTLRELEQSGGYDQAARDVIGRQIGRYENFATTGGVSEADRARLRGSGVYDEFARTGGVSAVDAANIRAKGTSVIPGFYGGLTEDINRARRISGGSSAMGNAMALRLARERSRAAAEASLNTELGLSDQIRQGRLAGAGGVSSTEQALQGLVTGNQLAGIGGAARTQADMSNAIAGTRLGAATNLGQSEQNVQGMLQRGRMFGTQGLQDVAGAEAAAASSGAGASAADARFRAGMQLEGLQGLYSLRGQAPGEVGMYDQNVLAGIGGRTGANLESTQQRYNAPGNQPFNWSQLIGAGVGAASGLLMPGAGAVIDPRKYQIGRSLPGGMF